MINPNKALFFSNGYFPGPEKSRLHHQRTGRFNSHFETQAKTLFVGHG
jgi:hypothetical protein